MKKQSRWVTMLLFMALLVGIYILIAQVIPEPTKATCGIENMDAFDTCSGLSYGAQLSKNQLDNHACVAMVAVTLTIGIWFGVKSGLSRWRGMTKPQNKSVIDGENKSKEEV